MPDINKFSWSDPKIVLHTTYAGILYFIVVTLFSVLNYKGMFFLDGTSVIFHIANHQWFFPAEQRDVMYLGQLLPVSFAMAGLPLKWIMIGYILNIYLFYFILFLVTALVFKDALAAILLLLLHYKGVPYNHFFTAEEILPGIYLLVVLISLIRNFNLIKHSYIGYGAILILLFFIIQSHPLLLACLGGAVVILRLSSPNLFILQKNVIIVAFVSILIMMGLKFFYFHNLDIWLFRSDKSYFQSLIQLLHPAYLSEIALYLFFSRKMFTLLFIVTIVYLIITGQYRSLAVFVGLTSLAIVLFNMQVSHTQFRIYELGHEMYDWWSLPIRFIVFSAFCFLVLKDIRTQYIFRITRLAFAFQFMVSSITFVEQHSESNGLITQSESIIDKSRKEGLSKVYIMEDELQYKRHPDKPFIGSLILSSISDPDSVVHIVYLKDEGEIEFLEQVEEDEIVLNMDSPPVDDEILDEAYFDIAEDDYSPISLKE